MRKPTVSIQKVTPTLAKAWLERNKRNRTVNQRRVLFYLDQMQKDQWQFSGDTIRFDWNDDLLDGQHRLLALIQYGEPIEFIIVEGLDPETVVVIDTGKTRSAGDAVSMLGVSYAATMAATVKTIIMFRNGRYSDKEAAIKGVSNTEIVGFIKKHQGLEDMIAHVIGLQHQFRFVAGSTLCALYFILESKHAATTEKFFQKFATGIDLSEKSPIRALRDKLMRDPKNQSNLTPRDKMALFIHAWNAHRRGRELENVRVRGDYVFPKPI